MTIRESGWCLRCDYFNCPAHLDDVDRIVLAARAHRGGWQLGVRAADGGKPARRSTGLDFCRDHHARPDRPRLAADGLSDQQVRAMDAMEWWGPWRPGNAPHRRIAGSLHTLGLIGPPDDGGHVELTFAGRRRIAKVRGLLNLSEPQTAYARAHRARDRQGNELHDENG